MQNIDILISMFCTNLLLDFPEETAGNRSSEGWHFDSHPMNGSSTDVDHINIYSKEQNFRSHLTWDLKL